MAINLNLDKYGAQYNAFVDFANANANDEDTLACIGGGALLDPDGKPRTIVAKNDGDKIKSLWKNQLFGRTGDQERLNNSVRDLFKETVFKVCGAKNFNELPPSVRRVMKEHDYEVDGGHPLSVRRILAVTSAILAEADKEAKSTSGGEQIQSAPQIDDEDEIESSVDDDEEVSFEYDTPDYVAGLPRETEVAFMEFYCDAVKTTVKDGRTKEDCDNTLRDMFKAIGYDKNDRKLLAELLAGGKPRFLDENGRLPFDFEASRFAKDFKSVLDLTKHYRAKLPKAYGDIVADTILAVLKTGGRMFDADELKPIDADLCEEIAATAKKIDAGKLLAPPSGKSRSSKSLAKALDAFRREAAGKFAAELLRPNDSDLMTKIKQSLLVSLAIAQGGAAAESLAEEIEEHGDELAAKYGMQDLLADIAPGLKYGAIE